MDRASISYCSATWTAYWTMATLPRVPCFGLTPAMPLTMKYVLRRSNLSENARAIIVAAPLISPIPVVSWQMEWSSAQWMYGWSIDIPGTWIRTSPRFPSPLLGSLVCHISPSSFSNWVTVSDGEYCRVDAIHLPC